MKCPKCGEEMREGYLATKNPLIFTTNKNKTFIFCGEDDVKLTGFFDWGFPEARICETCRWVLVDY